MFWNIERDFSTRDKYLLPLTLPYSIWATNLRIISHEWQFVHFELFKSTILCWNIGNVFQSEALRQKLMFNNGRDKAELFVINWTNNSNVINYIILYINKERFILLHQMSKVVTLSYYLIFLEILRSILCFFQQLAAKRLIRSKQLIYSSFLFVFSFSTT